MLLPNETSDKITYEISNAKMVDLRSRLKGRFARSSPSIPPLSSSMQFVAP